MQEENTSKRAQGQVHGGGVQWDGGVRWRRVGGGREMARVDDLFRLQCQEQDMASSKLPALDRWNPPFDSESCYVYASTRPLAKGCCNDMPTPLPSWGAPPPRPSTLSFAEHFGEGYDTCTHVL